MGNGSSQSIVLGPPRFHSSAYPLRGNNNGYSAHHPVPKFVHPQNRVLPKPVLNGQPPRLRSTDNGSILQAAGTIRGAGGHREAGAFRRGSGDGDFRRGSSGERDYDADAFHQGSSGDRDYDYRASRGGEKENERYMNLRNHRLFHSDPNIARRPSPVEGGYRRSGAAARLNKYKKKARAPDPPGSLDRKNNNHCKCIAKSRAPQPPSIVVHPPPPPPPPPDMGVTTRTTTDAKSPPSSSVTRAVTSYEKNVHPLEKWRRSDVRMDEHQDGGTRTTVFDSRKAPLQNDKSHLPPDPFQKEIQMVTRKIAESRHQTPPEKVDERAGSPPKFYFSDPSVFRADAKRPMENSKHKPTESRGRDDHTVCNGARREQTTIDEVVPALQRFSPGRQRFKPASRSSTPTPNLKAEKEWDDLSKSLYQKREEESKIDIRLRPVLPRKTPSAARDFSPAEAWQALGSAAGDNSSYSDLWTPRQDLSDASSDDGEGPPPPPPPLVPLARFSLPTVMFSNMRPIGTEVRAKTKAAVVAEEVASSGGFRRFLSRRSNNKYQSQEDIADSNWTFGQYGLQKRGKQYSSELLLSDRKKHELLAKNDFLGDILASKSDRLRDQMKSSDSGNSNFSFYSTDGQVMYRGRSSPPTRGGRVSDMRRRFDAHFESSKAKKKNLDLGRRRDLELAKMLEDEVRKRRNKEKISIRQQLQKMKSDFRSDEEEEDFDDEAYFTEPKSRETQSPFFSSDVGGPSCRTVLDSARLSHWQSSPALLEDSLMPNGMQPSAKGRLSLSSVVSSPDSGAWLPNDVDRWLRKQQPPGDIVRRMSEEGDGSSSPTPAAAPKKERRKTNIYKQLMDIVRKEERQLKNAQRGGGSGDSSSHRESSSETASITTSYSDSSESAPSNGRGVPANREFRHSLQPFGPNKGYRPVPFDLMPAYRLPGLQEEGKHIQAEVS